MIYAEIMDFFLLFFKFIKNVSQKEEIFFEISYLYASKCKLCALPDIELLEFSFVVYN